MNTKPTVLTHPYAFVHIYRESFPQGIGDDPIVAEAEDIPLTQEETSLAITQT